MKVVSDRDEMVFKYEYNDKPVYSIGLSKKDKDGNYIKGYKSVRFRKDVELDNMTKIRIKDSWIDFYRNEDGRTIDYIFINDFEKVGDVPVEQLNTKTIVQDEIDYEDVLPF